jgi:hypothetical protein
MQPHPITLQLVADTRIADRQREAESVRQADAATASAFASQFGVRQWLASALRAVQTRRQPAPADRPRLAYR